MLTWGLLRIRRAACAYVSVVVVSSSHTHAGLTHAMIDVLLLPPSASRIRRVSLESLYKQHNPHNPYTHTNTHNTHIADALSTAADMPVPYKFH